MAKIKKKHASFLGWEKSDFGGFDQILWDLDLDVPWCFSITTPEKQYITNYSAKKLVGILLKEARSANVLRIININKLTNSFISQITKYENDARSGKKPFSITLSYTFSKEDIKSLINLAISNSDELKSLITNYTNLLVNSKIVYEYKTIYGSSVLEEAKSSISFENNILSHFESKIQGIREKSFWNPNIDYKIGSKKTQQLVNETRVILVEKGSQTHYSNELVKEVKDLASALDINFAPDVMKLTSLRTGKMDMNKLAEAATGNLFINYRYEEEFRTKPFSVVMLCDLSGSMTSAMYSKGLKPGDKYYSETKLFLQKEILKILYGAFSKFLPDDKIWVYGHTGDYKPELYVFQDSLNPDFLNTINGGYDSIPKCQNYDGPIIQKVYEEVRKKTSEDILFISLSDGQPSGSSYGGSSAISEMKQIIEKCKRDNFVTTGIGIYDRTVQEIYKYNVVINNAENANKLISRLINEVVKTEFQ